MMSELRGTTNTQIFNAIQGFRQDLSDLRRIISKLDETAEALRVEVATEKTWRAGHEKRFNGFEAETKQRLDELQKRTNMQGAAITVAQLVTAAIAFFKGGAS
jgi:hypothetical protein